MIDGLQVSCMAAMPQMGMEPRQWLAALSGMGWSNGFLDDCGVIIYPSIQNIHIIINIYIWSYCGWYISIVYLWYIYGISMVYHVAPKKTPTCWNLSFGGFALQGLSYIFLSPWVCPRVACMQMSMGKMRMNNDILVGALLIFRPTH